MHALGSDTLEAAGIETFAFGTKNPNGSSIHSHTLQAVCGQCPTSCLNSSVSQTSGPVLPEFATRPGIFRHILGSYAINGGRHRTRKVS